MNQILQFSPRAEGEARQRVCEFVTLSRQQLTGLIATEAWDHPCWDVTSAVVRKGKPYKSSRLHLVRRGTLKSQGVSSTGEPFDETFGDFARAFLRYHHSAGQLTFDGLEARLLALQAIDAAFKSLGLASDITRLSAAVLFAAVRIAGENVTPPVGYKRAAMVKSVYDFCRERHFLGTSFVWKHGFRKPHDPTDRIGEDFTKRREAKVPSEESLAALGFAFREPKNVRDKQFSAVTAICLCVPIRSHEVLQLRVDCGCDEQRRTPDGAMVPAFGVRVFPGKGRARQIKWLPDMMVDVGREAIDRLRDMSAEARKIARWYTANPNSLFLPCEFEHIRSDPMISGYDMGELAGVVDSRSWAKSNRIAVARRDLRGRNYYYFEDFERAVLNQLPNDFPLQNGQPHNSYSGSLILCRRGALHANRIANGSQVMFEAMSVDTHCRWLSGSVEHDSVFERYGFVEKDGSSIEQTTHDCRHYLNDMAHRRGLGAIDIASWSGRDPSQNKYYDHQTPAQFHTQLGELIEQSGGIGPIFDAADSIKEGAPITRKEFLATQIGSAHHTAYGGCVHDYSLPPCQKFGNCLDCEENVFIKGDAAHRESMQQRYDLTLLQLEAAKAAMAEEDFGADLWVKDHTASLGRLALVLSVHDDATIADGTVVNLPTSTGDTEISLALRDRDAIARNGGSA